MVRFVNERRENWRSHPSLKDLALVQVRKMRALEETICELHPGRNQW